MHSASRLIVLNPRLEGPVPGVLVEEGDAHHRLEGGVRVASNCTAEKLLSRS